MANSLTPSSTVAITDFNIHDASGRVCLLSNNPVFAAFAYHPEKQVFALVMKSTPQMPTKDGSVPLNAQDTARLYVDEAELQSRLNEFAGHTHLDIAKKQTVRLISLNAVAPATQTEAITKFITLLADKDSQQHFLSTSAAEGHPRALPQFPLLSEAEYATILGTLFASPRQNFSDRLSTPTHHIAHR